jgi:ubiquitin C-terminal hydrolase
MRDEETGVLTKKIRRIDIPLSLQLRDKHGEKCYGLYSVIAHSGCGIDDGHYFCVFRVAEHWILGNDSELRGLSQDEIFGFLVQQRLSGFENISVYMIFYQHEEGFLFCDPK